MIISKKYWILTILVSIIILSPTFFDNAMFFDGVTYSTLSKNIANGIGTFWKPHYNKTVFPFFYEHPPLVFGIQSIFFTLIGDSMVVEKLYTFLMAILTLFGIILCWNLFFDKNEFKSYSWLPVLLWITVPIVFWSYRNNLLENTMGLFTLFSFYFFSKSFIKKKKYYFILANVLIILAFFSKGPVGLFPLVVPSLYVITHKSKISLNSLTYSIISFFIVLVLFSITFLLLPESFENIYNYMKIQLLPALNSERTLTTDTRFYITIQLLKYLSIPILILILSISSVSINKKEVIFANKKTSLFFLLTGISASFPIMLTLTQQSFYLVPSIPFYCLAISAMILPALKEIFNSKNVFLKVIVKYAPYLIVIIITLYMTYRFDKYSINDDKMRDAYLISKEIPYGLIVGTTDQTFRDWAMTAYLSRLGYLSLDKNEKKHTYFLLGKNETDSSLLQKSYNKLEIDLKLHTIYKISSIVK